ncbi:flagellar biosynthesis repressor FlbT [Sulfitobacter mediterraneus]|uniref:flagellar biosynthesis repressor FlbT n=1 Tax=Sulfitobacter mediterraneus TaxID=83219 RepID=UPI00193484DF|nr:flagellar biosynthesis repressor FlbT [Sulfitobacter mediterraneus]MBM1308770.1 flagellar biosynthesis repressor FlbT [Sulfitobacter mediterraneus]MBM1312655.1 flagellar biosynthesis repressor FlbT [Sulfitobacter mediterraneus]MBM1321037.1 flagellar biosynthesis repressor FlbT [Sulfitobacter mediterraneus]MBM1324924.1 flagellar biosynthesis repressor FlbT [Sulfitobacter mediterraneus]MBM1396271.1 flagellar biosynthesis repressor FlbT [Sulfitobacter mediterraneus]
MSGLVLKLSPKERVLINGAVIENGDRRSRLSIKTPDAHILRLRDAIHPEDAKTPVRRACFAVQLVLSGDSQPDNAQHGLLRQIEELSQVFKDPDSRSILAEAGESLIEGQHYRTLKSLRSLLAREDRLLAIRPS